MLLGQPFVIKDLTLNFNIFRGKQAFKLVRILKKQSNKASLTSGMVALLHASDLQYLDFDGPTLISQAVSLFNSCS